MGCPIHRNLTRQVGGDGDEQATNDSGGGEEACRQQIGELDALRLPSRLAFTHMLQNEEQQGRAEEDEKGGGRLRHDVGVIDQGHDGVEDNGPPRPPPAQDHPGGAVDECPDEQAQGQDEEQNILAAPARAKDTRPHNHADEQIGPLVAPGKQPGIHLAAEHLNRPRKRKRNAEEMGKPIRQPGQASEDQPRQEGEERYGAQHLQPNRPRRDRERPHDRPAHQQDEQGAGQHSDDFAAESARGARTNGEAGCHRLSRANAGKRARRWPTPPPLPQPTAGHARRRFA